MKNIYPVDVVQQPLAHASAAGSEAGQEKASRLNTVLALAALYFIWGSTYLAIRFALVGLPPFYLAGVRFVVAGGGLFLFLKARGAATPTKKQWIACTAIGALLLVGGNGSVTFAEQWVTSGLAAVAVATMPLWAALFAGLWGRWPTRLEWCGLAMGLVGVGLLNMEGNLQANPLGAIALLISTICWAFGSIWSRHLSLPSGLMSSACEMLAGGVLLLLIGATSGERVTSQLHIGPLLALAYLVVFGSLLAFSVYNYLLSHVRPALATSYAYVNPAVAVALGVALGGESITAAGLVAMVVISAAVALVALGRERTTAK